MGAVRFDRRNQVLVFDHAERSWNGSATLVLHESDLPHCTVVQLKHALDGAADFYGGPDDVIYVSAIIAAVGDRLLWLRCYEA
jgi:hypothetical protein